LKNERANEIDPVAWNTPNIVA